jgi:GrpB-like predicted nucleotidyltransferase (UPF0157 family)
VTRSEFYRIKAEEAEREARTAPEEQKAELMYIAERWRTLAILAAAHEEHVGSTSDDSEPGQ